MIDKTYCPTCGQSEEASEGSISHFKLCNTCAERRDEKKEHSEEDIQEEIKKQMDLTIKQSVR